MRTKICGIRNRDDAQIVVDSGASAIGFLIGTTHLAEDTISLDLAKSIIFELPPFISSVMVTHLTDSDEILEIANYIDVTTIQIHDYVTPATLKRIFQRKNNLKIIKAIPVKNLSDALKMLESYEDYCDAILLDSITDERIGGTGNIHDWNISKTLIEKSTRPVFLAGGLTPDNVLDAIKITKPFGVDVNSGVEKDGFKDPVLTSLFVKNANLREL